MAASRREAADPGQSPVPDVGEERQLLARCKAGDRQAFDELMRRHERKVYNFAYRLCGSYDEASDLASETFVRVYLAIGNFRGESSFITWLFRIVTNVYLDGRKRRSARQHESLEELVELEDTSVTRQVEDPSAGPAERLEDGERREILRTAIAELPEYQRVMIVLYHMEGQSYEEIAAALDLPIGTVKSRLNRARLALRERLAPLREHFPS